MKSNCQQDVTFYDIQKPLRNCFSFKISHFLPDWP
ncbi:hypothetical protein LRU_00667 [Ligilactobacillus ruminis SPM0211]|uniref:Uncharacterized protein n=1 Tax=Ligilactobacillus ruminis SPM0211 TaxID=1040964 RepID=F7QZ25_9LACO|nr:hypothetical protein LRU_00667 [Ligilactobacillus ruminis SPM0211]